MAIQLGVIQFRGKLGDVVGSKKSASQKANTLRVRQRTIANPKTTSQASQRMKMTPACNFYRALQHILNHSWQGVQYEGPSHARFMKLALSMKSGFPYVEKGSMNPVPGSYQISQGGLAPISVSYGDDLLTIGVNMGSGNYTDESTIGFISTQMLANNSALAEGDQLTFVLAIGEPGYFFRYRTARFVIDTKNTATWAEWLAAEWVAGVDLLQIGVSVDGEENKSLYVDGGAISAFAVIVSRPPVGKSGAWQRSNTYMTVREDVKLYYGSDSALQAALASYKNAVASYNSEWYLNQGNSSEANSSGDSVVSLQTNIGSTAFFRRANSSIVQLIVYQYMRNNNQQALGKYFAFKVTGPNAMEIIQNSGYETPEDAAETLGASATILLEDFMNYAPTWSVDTNYPSSGNQGGGNGGSVEEQP